MITVETIQIGSVKQICKYLSFKKKPATLINNSVNLKSVKVFRITFPYYSNRNWLRKTIGYLFK